MRTRDFIIILTCLAVAAGLLFAAGTQLDSINTQRHELKLVVNTPIENAPPSLAFATVAMGAFRGLVVDLLWMRADKLKDEGQFFDARQLAEWITLMQPRFAAVWEFQAWNMAYNISVAIPASQPEQRWQWVKNGYELLRDKGIPMNPKSLQLYRELGRIFQHKMGGVSDDAHKYYKLQMAEAWGPLLGSEDNNWTREDNEYYEALIETPRTWNRIAGDPNVTPLIQALGAADEAFKAEADFVPNYLALRQEPRRFKPAVSEVIDAFRGTPALKKFDIFAKAYQIRNTWKLDPVLMQELNRTYGPIDFADPNQHFPMDWRHPDAHAIYWAIKALKVAAEDENRVIQTSETNTDRIVVHSLQNLFRYGKITILEGEDTSAPDPMSGAGATTPRRRKDIFLGPDLRMFDSYNKAAMAILDKYKDDDQLVSLQNGHRNMLKNAVLSFYQAGIKGYALRIYNELRRLYPIIDFRVSLEQYVKNRLAEELESIGIHNATEITITTLTESYYLYAIGDDDTAAVREQFAQRVYDFYTAEYRDENRIDLPPMNVLKYVAIGQFLNSDVYPLYVRQGLLKRIEAEKPELYKQMEQTAAELDQKMQEQQETQ